MLKRFLVALFAMAVCGPVLAQQAQNPSFNLVNRSNNEISEIYATSAGVTTWGRNRLTQGSVQPGQSFPVRLPADGNCIYDVRVVYANGQADEQRAINTCNLDNVTFPAARGRNNQGQQQQQQPQRQQQQQQQQTDDPSFRLVNRGRSDVNEVYATVTGDNSWGRDRLGDDTVAPGASHVIRLPHGECMYDVKIVFADGQSTERRSVNLCDITDLRVP
jgi:hypothetical protein